MVIKKVKGGYVILHHRKLGLIGKRIAATKKPVSYKKALAINKAIYASEARRKNEKKKKKRK